MITCQMKLFISQEMCKRTEEVTFEPDIPICGIIFREPKASGPLAEESADDCLRITVRDGDKFGPASKTVDTGKMESLNVGGD